MKITDGKQIYEVSEARWNGLKKRQGRNPSLYPLVSREPKRVEFVKLEKKLVERPKKQEETPTQ